MQGLIEQHRDLVFEIQVAGLFLGEVGIECADSAIEPADRLGSRLPEGNKNLLLVSGFGNSVQILRHHDLEFRRPVYLLDQGFCSLLEIVIVAALDNDDLAEGLLRRCLARQGQAA